MYVGLNLFIQTINNFHNLKIVEITTFKKSFLKNISRPFPWMGFNYLRAAEQLWGGSLQPQRQGF